MKTKILEEALEQANAEFGKHIMANLYSPRDLENIKRAYKCGVDAMFEAFRDKLRNENSKVYDLICGTGSGGTLGFHPRC